MGAPLLEEGVDGEGDGEGRERARDEGVRDQDERGEAHDERPGESRREVERGLLEVLRSDGGGEGAEGKAGDEIDDVVLAGGECGEAGEREKGEGDGFPKFAGSKEEEEKSRAHVKRWKCIGQSGEADGDRLDGGRR